MELTNTKDVCLMFVRCGENKKLWEMISENVFSGKLGRHVFAFSVFFLNFTVSVLIK